MNTRNHICKYASWELTFVINLSLTSVYGIKADEAHTSLFLQVLELTLPVAAHGAVNLPEERERAQSNAQQQ